MQRISEQNVLAKFRALTFWLCDQFFWTVCFGGHRHPIFISTVHSSVIDMFYEPTGGLPGNSTDEVQIVAVG